MAFDPFVGLGSLISGIFSSINQHNQNEFNAEEAEKSRNWSAEQNSTQRWWQSNENTKAYERQLSMQEQGQSWQEKMWNLENQYNSPSAMMQRFREAGLNPFLSMGQSTLGNVSSPVPTAAMSGAPPATGSSMLGGEAARSSGLVNWNFDSLLAGIGVKANAANQRAQALDQLYKTYSHIYSNIGKEAAAEFKSKYIDSQSSDDPDSSREGMRYQKEMLKLDLENSMQDMQNSFTSVFGYGQAQANFKLAVKAIDETVSRIGLVDAEADESRARTKRVASQIVNDLMSSLKLSKEAVYYGQQAELIRRTLPLTLARLQMENGINAFDFFDRMAQFSSMSDVRQWLNTDEARDLYFSGFRGLATKDAQTWWIWTKDIIGTAGDVMNYNISGGKKSGGLHIRQENVNNPVRGFAPKR